MADPITTTITKDLTWIKGHIFLLLAVVFLIFIGIYGIEDVLAKHDKEKDAAAQQALAIQAAQTQALITKLGQDEQTWSQQNAQNQQIIAQLATAITTRDAATRKQQQVDATLSASAAAERISQQTGAKAGEVVANGDMIQLDLPITRQVVQQLDTIPALQGDLKDTQSQLTAETAVAGNLQSDLNGQKQLVGSLQAQNADQVKACAAQVKDLKAQARKSKLKWYSAGVVTGFLLHFFGI